MNCDEANKSGANVDESAAALNSLILDYYKKFGHKRDLEQYFSLSTAENEVKDVTGTYWMKMKSQDSEVSDSGEKKSESSTEICRISIKCTVPETYSSHEENTKTKSDSGSPPIITEEEECKQTDEESKNEDSNNEDTQSQKSLDAVLDTSVNKPFSPTSSITSQRKLEWDSLADVGYAHESDVKHSASSLSTLERLALKQQYSNNDTQHKSDIGAPTAHSTPVDVDLRSGNNKGAIKKTKIYKKDVDIVEVNLPSKSDVASQGINVNLTKHISFNMDKDGGVTIENVKSKLDVSPEEHTSNIQDNRAPQLKADKEVQTSLTKKKETLTPEKVYSKPPVFVNSNTLKKKYRRKKYVLNRRRLRYKKDDNDKENIPLQEKSAEQVSAAESFEYMPGHVYNQNQMNKEQVAVPTTPNRDNKSSLESSGPLTTDSSKASKYSFTKDLEKSISLLKNALHKRHNDTELKHRLVKEVVQQLLKSKYRDDESTTDFLSGLSFNSKKLGLDERRVTSSTSDSNNTDAHITRARKSILRLDKFNLNPIASASQSAPNLPSVAKSERPVVPNQLKSIRTNTESDMSSEGKNSSDEVILKTSSEELYRKYLEAKHREESYKKHLRDKELLLKQKLVANSETAIKSRKLDIQVNNRLKNLIKDLTRNNYDDGSGDASKLEGGNNFHIDFQSFSPTKKNRNHSVFTLSSANSDDNNRKANLKKRLKCELKDTKTEYCKEERHCLCKQNFFSCKDNVTDSSVQVNINSSSRITNEKYKHQGHLIKPCEMHKNVELPSNFAHVVSDDVTGNIKYVCLCSNKSVVTQELPENMLIYKCSKLDTKESAENVSKTSNTIGVQCVGNCQQTTNMVMPCQASTSKAVNSEEAKCKSNNSGHLISLEKTSKFSQTNIPLRLLEGNTDAAMCHSSKLPKPDKKGSSDNENSNKNILYEATRCIQTEISINPKISDPSLTDINLVNENDCAKLISEHCRLVIKKDSDVDTLSSHESKHNTESSKSSERNSQTRNVDFITINSPTKDTYKPTQCRIELNDYRNIQNPIHDDNNYTADNFTIPIQGTNMTLMVKIGSKNEKQIGDKNSVDTRTHTVGTDGIVFTENATSLTEECSKSVQSKPNEDIALIEQDNPHQILQTTIQSEEKNLKSKEISNMFYQRCVANPCINEIKRHTHPKDKKLSSKPLLRSNTDSGRFIASSLVQTDSIKQMDAMTQENKDEDKQMSGKEVSSDNSGKSKNSTTISSMTSSWQQRKLSLSDAQSRKSSSDDSKDPIIDMIKDITRRYSKKDLEKYKDKKKCFKEIITVLNYLLDTDDGTDVEGHKVSASSSGRDTDSVRQKLIGQDLFSNTSSKDKPDKNAYKQHKFRDDKNFSEKGVSCDISKSNVPEITPCITKDKAIQSTLKKSKVLQNSTDSSEIQASTEFPGTTSDSATCKILNKIKKECESYHQKRCKGHSKKCEASSSTSVNCDDCKHVHHCNCRSHRCNRTKSSVDKFKKKCVAYNLFIQTSDSMVDDDTLMNHKSKPLQSIVVKVPPKRKQMENMPFKEVFRKIERTLPQSPRGIPKTKRSHSLPNESEISSNDDQVKKCQGYTVREYLEINRPDFVEKSSNRQQCLRRISEKRNKEPCAPSNLKMVVVHTPGCMRPVDACNSCNMYCGGFPMSYNTYNPYMHCMQNEVTRIANERATNRQLLSVQLEQRPSLTSLSESDLRRLAEELGVELRRKKLASKFVSEREMKKHSEKIYKSLPEVVQKKEELKKENIKKTNLLMANIFKKNLQKKTLRGTVNLSNYSTVIKI